MATTCQKHPNAFPASLDLSARVLCKEGRLKEAVQTLHITHDVNPSAYVYLLQCCIQKKALHHGKRVHALILNRHDGKFSENRVVQNTLLAMYVKCGSIIEARKFFDAMLERDVLSWNIMIAAYKTQGLSNKALALFYEMYENGFQFNEFTFSSVISASASVVSLREGIKIHQKVIRSGFHSHAVVVNALIYMYGKFGNMYKARVLFDKMCGPNVVSWTTIIAGYVQNGFHDKAFKVFKEMQRIGVQSNEYTFGSVIAACAGWVSLAEGIQMHQKIIRSGFQSHNVVMNTLIEMYAKHGNMHKARVLFDNMKQRDKTSWNAMITGYSRNGLLNESVKLFDKMHEPDIVSWTAMITGYIQNGLFEEAVKLFKKMPQRNITSCNAMITGYAQNGLIEESVKLFKDMSSRNTISWNAMLSGYVQNGLLDEALTLFNAMPGQN